MIKPTSEQLKELEKVCELTRQRSGGPGGQHRNKVETSVRVKHKHTGLVCLSRKHRSQHQNKIAALTRLWQKLEARKQVKKKRIKTRPSKGSQQRRLDSKKRQSKKKQDRKYTASDD